MDVSHPVLDISNRSLEVRQAPQGIWETVSEILVARMLRTRKVPDIAL